MTVAPWSKRAFAWLIDMHISMIFLVIAYVVTDWAFKSFGTAAAWTIAVVAYVVWWMVGFMNRCVRMGRTGQSLGRALFNVSLVRESNGEPTGIWKAFVRENTHFVDYFTLGYGWLRPLKDRKGQTYADLFTKTITVEGAPPRKHVVIVENTPADVAEPFEPAVAPERAGTTRRTEPVSHAR